MARSIIAEVEEEYGEPFWDVVRGFAEDGHRVHATALLLGYSSDTPFRRLISRHGVDIEFASAQESVFQVEARVARRGRATPAALAACKIASEGKTVHPTQKPVALMEYLIRTYTNEGETVLDNCAGSGTTGVACVNTGRNFIGIERDDKYFSIAQERIANARRLC